ncbi:hypothetical protein [Mariprofundus ferrooxydans]|nr:hypothetical protein [Mariprofundus ferrooxydans]
MKKMMMISMVLAVMAGGQQAMAQGSVRHSGQALNHSVQASGHAVVAGAQLTSAAIAIPMVAAGAVGAASTQSGAALLKQADSDFDRPLSISEETVTAGPAPSEALYGHKE